MRPAIFLDRDGVINENRPDYVKSWAEFRFLPRALQALKQLASRPWPMIIVTNQSAVGRGIITPDQLELIHEHMLRAIVNAGGRIDAVYVCPHHPAAGCDCRKPAAGLLRQAALELDLDLAASVFVGDSQSDMEAARAVRAQPILVRSGRDTTWIEKTTTRPLLSKCLIVADLAVVAARLTGLTELDPSKF